MSSVLYSVYRTSFKSSFSRLRFASTKASAIAFSQTGAPQDVVKIISYDLDAPSNDQILVKTLASPINPADINQLEGVYPSMPAFTKEFTPDEPHAIGGNEGLFEIVEVGSGISGYKPGDWAIPKLPNFGTWRSHAIVKPSDLIPIVKSKGTGSDITKVQAATISVNPCTAHQMLTKFTSLKKGDWFIQNGGNSAVGRAAIQLGRIWGFNSISVVRPRENLDDLVSELKSLGATEVITEDQLLSKSFRQTIKDWTRGSELKLALNCVGGKSCTGVARQLSNGGHLVTYGGMSKQPVTLPTSLFIFKNITAHGYWLTAWTKQDPEGKQKAVEEIVEYIRQGEFKDVPVNQNKFDCHSTDEEKLHVFKKALESATKGFSGKKQILVFEH